MAKRYVKPPQLGPLRPNYIRAWRERARLSGEDLAEMLETSNATVWRVENGKQGYSQDFLEAAAAILGCEPWDLIMRPPSSVDSEWSQEWDEIRDQFSGREKNQALAHLRAILSARPERENHG